MLLLILQKPPNIPQNIPQKPIPLPILALSLSLYHAPIQNIAQQLKQSQFHKALIKHFIRVNIKQRINNLASELLDLCVGNWEEKLFEEGTDVQVGGGGEGDAGGGLLGVEFQAVDLEQD